MWYKKNILFKAVNVLACHGRIRMWEKEKKRFDCFFMFWVKETYKKQKFIFWKVSFEKDHNCGHFMSTEFLISWENSVIIFTFMKCFWLFNYGLLNVNFLHSITYSIHQPTHNSLSNIMKVPLNSITPSSTQPFHHYLVSLSSTHWKARYARGFAELKEQPTNHRRNQFRRWWLQQMISFRMDP